VGEIANISMGSSATTLYALVNRKVNITTPEVTLANWDTVIEDYEKPCVFIQIRYTVGLDGSNIMILKESDVKIITDLMMGGDGSNLDDELGELHLSAISEAMNQMMGASATSLSTMLGKVIDISPPEARRIDLLEYMDGGEIASFLAETFVKITFRMQIGDLVDSTIMQLYPIDFAKTLFETFMSSQTGSPAPAAAAKPEPPPAPAMNMGMPQTAMPDMSGMSPANGMPQMGMDPMGMGGQMGMQQMPQMGMQMPQMGMQQMPQMGMQMPQMGMQMPQMGMGQMGMPQMGMPMNIQPAQFQSFATDFSNVPGKENINLIMDVPLEVTVELGRCIKSISEILEFSPGTIIELDKIAGEPIDVLVNGKFIAKGEVVVIEESFGVRVTEIIK
ncbi:MAG: flagellar motor switch phosphatase FliY, partial [Lachnospiraceae bacterium]|nr:flagellar motor switch phosphatase FliY [Lachnospiraceae bacterium]